MGESSCLIIDVRVVTVTPGAPSSSSSTTTAAAASGPVSGKPGTSVGTGTGTGSGTGINGTVDPYNQTTAVGVVAVEPTVPGKCYWTILPLDTKKLPGLGPAVGGQYVAGGAFQVTDPLPPPRSSPLPSLTPVVDTFLTNTLIHPTLRSLPLTVLHRIPSLPLSPLP